MACLNFSAPAPTGICSGVASRSTLNSVPDFSQRVKSRGRRSAIAHRSARPHTRHVLIDKRHHHFTRRSSSAWAKKAAALRRISLARFNSRLSRSSSLRRSRSTLDRPSRFPWSRSACRTHFLKVSAVHQILPAIETIVSHCDWCSSWCSNTSRTARSRTSGENFFVLFMTPFSQGLESPGNPGRFTGHQNELNPVAKGKSIVQVSPSPFAIMAEFEWGTGCLIHEKCGSESGIVS